MADRIIIGIDIGTSGVRAVGVDSAGRLRASAEAQLSPPREPHPGWKEQSPEDWWRATCDCLRQLIEKVPDAEIAAICADSTSGTVLPITEDGKPLRDALMYNDARASEEADILNAVGARLIDRMGYRFNSSYGLSKILWIARNEPAIHEQARYVNAADFIAGRLCGDYGHTDYTNALKMGYDLLEGEWPAWLDGLGVRADRLPVVHATGDVVGSIQSSACDAAGLTKGTPVAIGPTDGTAAFYASGALRPGEGATTLGTTLVIKSVSGDILRDPQGRVYCHKHADGFWLPGGASNCGCGYATRHFPGADLPELTIAAADYLPCSLLVYPLPGRGERFPVVAPEADGFCSFSPLNKTEQFAAYLQGVAYVERWAYETVAELGGETTGAVYSSGGGSRSDLWMQLRADVMNREVTRAESPDSAFGSAILAASHILFDNVAEAVAAMVRVEGRFEPDIAMHKRYSILYQRFRAECAERGIE
jgi:D-ribulokinase